MHQAQRLAELTGLAVRYGPTQHYQGGLYGNAVLTKLPILDVRIEPLPYTESTPEKTTYPRGAIAVTARRSGGPSGRFISTGGRGEGDQPAVRSVGGTDHPGR